MLGSRKIVSLSGNKFRDDYSLAFDGTDDYIDFGNRLNLGTGDFSISLWVKAPSDWNNTRILVKKQDVNNRYYLRIDNSNPPVLRLICVIGGVTTISFKGGSTPNLDNLINQWVHFVISADRDGVVAGYVNGQLDASPINAIIDATDLDNTANLNVAKYDSTYYTQSISEIAYYDKALSSSEVATIYNGREPFNHKESSFSGNLTAWWRMGDGSIDRQSVEGGIITDMTKTTYIDWSTDLVTNGRFAGNADGWSLGSGWAYDSSNVTCSSANSNLSQDVSAVAKTVYRVELNITDYTSGTLIADIGGSSSISFPQATGSHVVYMLTVNTNDLRFYGGAFRGTVDNIRVLKVFGTPGVTYNMTPSDFTGDTL